MQDIIPYTCIFEDCGTPDNMYLTSDELMKHTREEHSVSGWVCDPCASKSETGTPPCFQRLEEWEFHIKTEHTASFLPSQLSSLAKLSQRRILEPLGCPLCGHTTGQPQTTLDEHITQHLHDFALRCLPWGAGSIDGGSNKAKSARESHLSDMIDTIDNDIAIENFDPKDPSSLLRAIEDLRSLQGNPTLSMERVYREIWQDGWKTQRERLHNVLLLVDFRSLTHQATILGQQRSLPASLGDFDSFANGTKSKKGGKLWNFIPGSTLGFPAAEDALQETFLSHVTKILFIMRQALVTWHSFPYDGNIYGSYRAEKRNLGANPGVITVESYRRAMDVHQQKWWDSLSHEEKQGIVGALRSKTDFFDGIRVLLEDELDAMESAHQSSLALLEWEDTRAKQSTATDAEERVSLREEPFNPATPSLEGPEEALEPQRITHPEVMAIIHEVVDNVFEFFPATLDSEINRRLEHAGVLEESTVQEFLRIYDQAGGDAVKIAQIARKENLEDQLAYWLELTISFTPNASSKQDDTQVIDP